MKEEYLAVYDYGMGGVWFIVLAESSQQIGTRFPFLEVVEPRPSWLGEEEYATIKKENFIDIDAPPSELLKRMLIENQK